ncbi:MAG: molybdenum cofactor biosynthesis protein MoeB, partial [Gemmatimonadales bacterium]|nr:molybdenum cofactor biosynthesis protein MoeB [Gemmatimonadales bacterium]
LGSPAALYLAAAGVGRLGLVDHDRVELSNLQRQVLYDTDAVGTPKLASARARLTGLNPDIAVETFETRMDSRNAFEILEGWDFVIDGSDNFPTRYLVNDACVMLGTPFAYGAILRFEGQASVFGAPDGPCYRCLFRDPPPPGLVPNCAEAGVLGVLPGIVGSIQANEAIKWLAGIGDTLAGRLLLIDALRMEFRSLDIAPDPECAVCGPEPTVTELIDYERFCGAPPDGTETEGAMHDLDIDVHELKRRIDAGERFQLIDVREDYEWAICNLEEAGARLVPLATLPDAVESLDASEPLIIHCRSGPRGDRAVEYLRAVGFDNAVNLAGGILAWAEEIDPAMPQY